ncbi:MAG: lipid-A-disaccharide synthase [Burkholderiaceae bacterium]
MPILNSMPDVAMVAGEASGDLLGALLLQGLLAKTNDVAFGGIGGPRMAQLGFDAQIPLERLAVRGYVEVLRHLLGLLKLRSGLAKEMIASPPRLFIGIDAPDFNLGLEEKLRAARIRTVHLVCPSIWAWRAQRITQIKRSVDHMLCVFPFEPELLEKHGVKASYVGHPLADMIPLQPNVGQARRKLGLEEQSCIIALLPGSRKDEIAHIAPLFLKAAELLRIKEPNARFLIPAASELRRVELQRLFARFPGLPVQLVDGQSHTVLEACSGVLVASGTATLEAALYKKPMVIAYAMPTVSWWMMRNKGYLPYVGLPNILAGEFLVPELIQDKATPSALAGALIEQMRDRTLSTRLNDRFMQMHEQLRCDFSRTAADVVMEYL